MGSGVKQLFPGCKHSHGADSGRQLPCGWVRYVYSRQSDVGLVEEGESVLYDTFVKKVYSSTVSFALCILFDCSIDQLLLYLKLYLYKFISQELHMIPSSIPSYT